MIRRGHCPSLNKPIKMQLDIGCIYLMKKPGEGQHRRGDERSPNPAQNILLRPTAFSGD